MTYETIMAEQFLSLKNASKIEDIPNKYLAWDSNFGFVWFSFTGKFRKVEIGEFNRRIAGRNRPKLVCYQPEFEFDGRRFPLNIVSLKSVPDELIVS